MSDDDKTGDQILEPEVLDPAIPAVETAIAEYSPLARGIALMRHRVQNIAYDLASTKGNREARRDRALLVRARNLLDDRRKDLNKADRERIQRRDEEAKRLTSLITELEEPLDRAIRADEERREREKQEKEAAEKARVEALQARVEAIRQIAAGAIVKNTSGLSPLIAQLVDMPIDESFAEFRTAAQRARDETLAMLNTLHAKAFEAEERERKEAEARAENQRQDGVFNTFVHGLGNGFPEDLQAELERVCAMVLPPELEDGRASRAREAYARRADALRAESVRRQQAAELARQEDENRRLREEAAQRERERVIEERRQKAHQDKLNAWRAAPAQHMTATAQQLECRLRDWKNVSVGDEWEEFRPEAQRALDEVIQTLTAMLELRQAAEAREAELDRQRVELARQAQELAERRREAEAPESASEEEASHTAILAADPTPHQCLQAPPLNVTLLSDAEERLICDGNHPAPRCTDPECWHEKAPRPNVYVAKRHALTVTVDHPSNADEVMTFWIGGKSMQAPRVDELIDALVGICETAIRFKHGDDTVPRDRIDTAKAVLERIRT